VHVLGAIVPRRADVATVQFCHAGFRVSAGGLAPEGLPLPRRANTALTRLLSLAAERRTYRPARVGVLAPVSRGVAGELERHYGGIPLTVTPNGVDTGRFRPDPAVRSSVRAELGAAEDETVLLFVGGDWDRKGLGVTIGALGRAPERLRLWIVGRGPEARFRALARERGVEERVTFLGPRSDAERFYQGADVFVLPTLYETFSIAAHEAAASALPVVATAVSGIEELVGADESGILVERDETALAAALARLAGDPALRRRLGEEGRRRAERLDWERSARSVLDTYSSLLAEARC